MIAKHSADIVARIETCEITDLQINDFRSPFPLLHILTAILLILPIIYIILQQFQMRLHTLVAYANILTVCGYHINNGAKLHGSRGQYALFNHLL